MGGLLGAICTARSAQSPPLKLPSNPKNGTGCPRRDVTQGVQPAALRACSHAGGFGVAPALPARLPPVPA